MILADGQEVHYANSRNNMFEYSWTMKGNHVLKIIAHASPPLSPTPGFRQYDFFVNGQSFFSFPKVFRVGLPPNDPRARSPGTARMAEASHRYTPGTVGRRSNSTTGIVSLEAPGNVDEVRKLSFPPFVSQYFLSIHHRKRRTCRKQYVNHSRTTKSRKQSPHQLRLTCLTSDLPLQVVVHKRGPWFQRRPAIRLVFRPVALRRSQVRELSWPPLLLRDTAAMQLRQISTPRGLTPMVPRHPQRPTHTHQLRRMVMVLLQPIIRIQPKILQTHTEHKHQLLPIRMPLLRLRIHTRLLPVVTHTLLQHQPLQRIHTEPRQPQQTRTPESQLRLLQEAVTCTATPLHLRILMGPRGLPLNPMLTVSRPSSPRGPTCSRRPVQRPLQGQPPQIPTEL